MARFKLDPSAPSNMTEQERTRLEAMTDAEITAAALTDPDNPPMTEAEIERYAFAALAQRARAATGLTQRAFADRFRIGYDRLRDIERGRSRKPDTALAAYFRVILHDPKAVASALEAAE